jgi:hypothetical protein
MIVANPARLSFPPLCELCLFCLKNHHLQPRPVRSPHFIAKSRRIRTYAKRARNPFTMNTSETQHLKSFRIRTYEKTGGEGVTSPARFGEEMA